MERHLSRALGKGGDSLWTDALAASQDLLQELVEDGRLHVLIAFILAHAVVAAKLAVGASFCMSPSARSRRRIDRAAEAFHQATNHDPTVSRRRRRRRHRHPAQRSARAWADGATSEGVGRGMERVLRIVCRRRPMSTKIGIGITTASSDATTAQIHMVENRVAPRLLILWWAAVYRTACGSCVGAIAGSARWPHLVVPTRDAHCRAPMRTLLRHRLDWCHLGRKR